MSDNVTDGPWKIDGYSIVASEVPTDGGDIIADAPEYAEDSMKRWEANAYQIVKCVNLHDELVEALRNAVRIIDFEDGTKTINEARDLLVKIDSYADGEK
jgi:hypothetical protein